MNRKPFVPFGAVFVFEERFANRQLSRLAGSTRMGGFCCSWNGGLQVLEFLPLGGRLSLQSQP